MRPRFWYCPLCGYMFLDKGTPENAEAGAGGRIEECCPMCGEDAVPCWECISGGVFSDDWCHTCESSAECQTRSPRDRRAAG
jgi:hypothetical protein